MLKNALKRALSDRYNTLIALNSIKIDRSIIQAPSKAQPFS